jgi:hypothetical protein
MSCQVMWWASIDLASLAQLDDLALRLMERQTTGLVFGTRDTVPPFFGRVERELPIGSKQ